MGSPTTSSRILNAAIDLFSTNAYSEISVDEIAQKAGLTKMTLYQHYKSKDRLLLACLKARLERREMKLDLFLEGLSPKADPLLAIFDWLEGWLNPTNFKGCAFVKAFNELSVIVPEVRGIALEAKEKIQKRLTSLAKKTSQRYLKFDPAGRPSDDLVVWTRTREGDRWRLSQGCLAACFSLYTTVLTGW